MARAATPKQMAFIRKLHRDAGIKTPAPKKGELSITEASRYIEALLNLNRGWGCPPGGNTAPAILTDAELAAVEAEAEYLNDGTLEAEEANERYFEERGGPTEPEDLPF